VVARNGGAGGAEFLVSFDQGASSA
jgi:hypothetical protein